MLPPMRTTHELAEELRSIHRDIEADWNNPFLSHAARTAVQALEDLNRLADALILAPRREVNLP